MMSVSSRKRIALGDLCSIITKGTTPKAYVASGIPFLRAENLRWGDVVLTKDTLFIDAETDSQLARSRIKGGDVLLSIAGTIGRGAIVPMDFLPMNCNQAVAILRVSSELNRRYFLHWLRSQDAMSQIADLQVTATIPNLSLGCIKSLEIPLPPLSEQKCIADILDKADELREKRKQSIAKIDKLVQSVFVDMFGDPVANPKGWEVQRLGDMSKCITSGNTPKGGRQVYIENGIAFFRSQNVWRNRIDIDDIAYIDNKTHFSMRKSSLKQNDILMTKTGRINTDNSSLGRAALFSGKDDTANINGHVYLIRLKEGNLHDFVLHILISEAYRDYIRSVCVGGIDKRQINKCHIEDFPIISPPLDLQNKYVKFAKKVVDQKKKLSDSAFSLDAMFSTLQQKAFKGEL
jgi:type I restriction enzyme S subunit